MSDILKEAFSPEMVSEYVDGLYVTLYITVISTLIAYIIGVPLGILLYITDSNGIYPKTAINKTVGVIVNIMRSVPFLILLVLALPLTKVITGQKTGNTAFMVPLILSAAPFVARMVESSLKEIDTGIIEAAKSMGSNNFQIITKVLLPESKPSLLIGAAIAFTTILGYTPFATVVGGTGLGALAVQYGLYRHKRTVMYVASLLLIIIVQIIQELGMKYAKHTDKRI